VREEHDGQALSDHDEGNAMSDQPMPPDQPADDAPLDETPAEPAGEASTEVGQEAPEATETVEATAADEPAAEAPAGDTPAEPVEQKGVAGVLAAPDTSPGAGAETTDAVAEAAAPSAPVAYRPPASPLTSSPTARPPMAPIAVGSPGPSGAAGQGETAFEIAYPEQSSRLWAALFLLFGLKFLVLIVHAVILAVLQVGAFFVFIVTQLVVLVTGRMPEGMHRFQTRVIAQGNKMNAWLYGLTDELPPFFLSDDPYPVQTSIGHPQTSSRLWALLNIVWLKPIALLPHLIILYVLAIAMMVVVFIAQVVILFTGNYTQGMFDFVVGVMRWQTRMNAFLWGLRDEYPPFSLS